jgi:excinuclease ABC subunit B
MAFVYTALGIAAGLLSFELAARLRDEIRELKRELKGMQEAGN